MRRDEIAQTYMRAPHDFWSSPLLSLGEKAVLMVLYDSLGENETCWPKDSTVGLAINLTREAVNRCCTRMRKTGILRRTSAGWVITWPPPAAATTSSVAAPAAQPKVKAQKAKATKPTPAKPPKVRRTDDEIKDVLATFESRLAYLTGGTMQWWPTGKGINDALDASTLNASQLAGAYWYYCAGMVPAESLPAGKFIGMVSNVLKTTPAATVWQWLCDACRLWPAARLADAGLPAISPEVILQGWWRDRLHRAGTATVSQAQASPGLSRQGITDRSISTDLESAPF